MALGRSIELSVGCMLKSICFDAQKAHFYNMCSVTKNKHKKRLGCDAPRQSGPIIYSSSTI